MNENQLARLTPEERGLWEAWECVVWHGLNIHGLLKPLLTTIADLRAEVEADY